MFPTESPVKFGYNAVSEADRLNRLPPEDRFNYLFQEQSSYINHLAQDEAVSILYPYYLDDSADVFVSPTRNKETNVKYQIDFHERNGLFYEGLLLAAKRAQENPFNIVVLYSPTGKKLFDDTPTDDIEPSMLEFLKKPYTAGQLYFLFNDGDKINNVAVSINRDNNPWLNEISDNFNNLNKIENEEQRIFSYLITPVVIGDLDDFFQKRWRANNLIYTNKRKQQYFLNEVIYEIKETFAGKKRLPVNVYDATVSSLNSHEITAAVINRGYRLLLANFMEQNNLSVIELGGGCPGGTIRRSELLERSPLEVVSSFSSHFRFLKQGISDLIGKVSDNSDENSEGYLCKGCGHRIPWEKNVKDKIAWLRECPNCKTEIKCV